MKKILSIALTLIIIGTSAVSAFAASASYTDVPATHWAYTSIESCKTKGLMTGVGNNKFDPEGTLTRAQVAQICYNAYHSALPSMITNASIDDVASDAWYRDAMYWIVANGIMEMEFTDIGQYGYPNEIADRKLIALILYRLVDKLNVSLPETNAAITFPDVSGLAEDYQKAIDALQRAGIISGYPDGNYSPDDPITRAQAAKLFDVYTEIDGLYSVSSPEAASYYDSLRSEQKLMLSELEAALRICDYETASRIQSASEFHALCDAIPDWGGFWYHPDDETRALVYRGSSMGSYEMALYIGSGENGSYRLGKYAPDADIFYSLSKTSYSNGKANGPFTTYFYFRDESGEIALHRFEGNLIDGVAQEPVNVYKEGEPFGHSRPESHSWWPDWPEG